MKNVFDMDMERDGYDGQVFCINEVETAVAVKVDEMSEEISNATEQAEPSWAGIIVEIICWIIIAAGVRGVLDTDISLREAFANAPYVFAVIGVAAVVLLGIFVSRRKKMKRFEQSLEENQMMEVWDDTEKEVAKALGIPEDSRKVDVFAEIYEIKKGKKKVVHKPLIMNYCMNMYIKERKLCFADMKQEMGIPIEEISAIKKVKKRENIANWNKEEAYKSKKYKKYKITENNLGLLIKSYYSIRIDSIWGAYEIRLPDYEEEAVRLIEEITGKSVLN